MRLVRCRHEACGEATRVRLPRVLPARAVRRVVCDGCSTPFHCDFVEDDGVVAAEPDARPVDRRRRPRLKRPRWSGLGIPGRLSALQIPRWLSNPQSWPWRYLSIPLAAAAVLITLILIQGSGGSARDSASSTAPAAPGPSTKAVHHQAQLIKGQGFTLALPQGWRRTEPPHGATFGAVAVSGGAKATLWVRHDPKLSFPQFEARSLAQLRSLAGSAHVANRVTAPTADATVVKLAADAPPGGASYEVTLRVAGPYRYYLSTTVEPNAPREAADGADLIHNSLVPMAKGGRGR